MIRDFFHLKTMNNPDASQKSWHPHDASQKKMTQISQKHEPMGVD
jgi:hypothetical protein